MQECRGVENIHDGRRKFMQRSIVVKYFVNALYQTVHLLQ